MVVMMMVMICGDNYDRPWDIDPVPAAREDEDHAAVAEQGEQEDDPDSTSEGPPENCDDHDHDRVDDDEEQAEEYNNERDDTIANDPDHPEAPASCKV